MNPSKPFILRPVATSLFMVAILLAGIFAYRLLPISALPQVDYPTIQVVTLYPGASPEVITSSITAPLERQFGQMPGLARMASTSSGGASMITLTFSLDLTLDVAEQEVQAAINAASNLLPTDLPTPPIYNKVNPADAPILTLGITSSTIPLPQVEDLVDTRLAQKLSQVAGVGLVSISGGQRPAVRVQADPRALAAQRLTLDDVRTAVGAANVNQAKGSFDGPTRASTIDANDQLKSVADYEHLIIAYRNGAPIRLSDVAKVVDSAENVQLAAWANERAAIILNIQRQPGANVIAVVDRINQLLPKLQSGLPASVEVIPLTDRTVTIRASVADVQSELFISIALVVMVVFLFLRNIPATIIPGVAVPLSLVGTFSVIYLAGFSINNLTLMALTVATGFVVDDAIVMIENISRYIEKGEAPLKAALKGAEQIGFTIISLTVSLIAVLIPLLFMGDVVGRLFREFAITLAVAILISAVVSLTLTPMMCAKLLHHTPEEKQGRFFRASGHFLDGVIARYGAMLRWVLKHQPLTIGVATGTLLLTVVLYVVIPKGFFPVQDTGAIQGVSQAAQSISFSAMADRQQALGRLILADEDVASLSSYIGVDGTNATLNSGRFLINMKPQHQRKGSASEVIRRLEPKLAALPGIRLYLQPVQDLSIESLQNEGLQAYIDIDRDSAARLGITVAAIDNALYNAFGQRLISTIFTQSNQYRVVLEAPPALQRSLAALENLYVTSSTGAQVRLTAVAKVSERYAPLAINHVAQFPSATVSFNLAPGYALGDAVKAIEAAERDMAVPPSIQVSFQGAAEEFGASLTNTLFLIIAAIITMYIVLGVLYESYIHPITILSTLPSAGVGALLALQIAKTDLGMIGIIGIILLIGIVKKNAIMMIDFALQAERDEGMAPAEAIYQACLLRFRPIMMTTMAALLGALPLMLGTGVGSELRHPLGITMVGGLIVSQMLTLFTTPVIYLMFDRLSRRFRKTTPAVIDAS